MSGSDPEVNMTPKWNGVLNIMRRKPMRRDYTASGNCKLPVRPNHCWLAA